MLQGVTVAGRLLIGFRHVDVRGVDPGAPASWPSLSRPFLLFIDGIYGEEALAL